MGWIAHIKHMDFESPVRNLHLQKFFEVLSKRCEEHTEGQTND